MPATVRISNQGHALLGELAIQTRSTMTEVLDAALDLYRRHRFLQQANDAYAVLADDAAALASYREELAALDATVMDGLEETAP